MLTLAYPWLLLLVLLPITPGIRQLLRPYREARPGLFVPSMTRLEELTQNQARAGAAVRRRTRTARVLAWLSWGLLVVAVARPQWLGEPIVQIEPSRDLVLAVDLSGSMQTEDFTTPDGQTVDRLTAVKQVLDDFLAARQGDRVGLVLFGSGAFVQAPFTADLDVCRQLLDEATVGMAGPRTALGDALGVAVKLFQEGEVQEDRVAILLTDGNDTGSRVPLKEAASLAGDERVVVHTIAVGDPTAVGEAEIDEEALRRVAEATGGRSFRAEDRDALAAVYAELDALSTRDLETRSHRPRTELFVWPLGLVLVVSLLWHLAHLVGARWPSRGARRTDAAIRTAAALALAAAPWALAAGGGTTGGFHLLRPWWCLAAAPALAFLLLHRRGASLRSRLGDRIAPHLLQALTVEGRGQARCRPAHALALFWLLGIVAAAGPAWRVLPSPFAEDDAAVMVVVEVSESMQAEDIQPSRLERTAQKIADFTALRPGTRHGLVAYSGTAHLVVPPTRDAELVVDFVRALRPDVLPKPGDEPAAALALAAAQLERSHLPGSILLCADDLPAVSHDRLAALRDEGLPPVQILAATATPDTTGLPAGAGVLGARIVPLTPAPSDVENLAARAATTFRAASSPDGRTTYADDGYWLLPLLLALALLWFRPGWIALPDR